MMSETIEVRYLETMQHLVDFFELSPGELEELTAKHPFPDGQTLENFKMTPPEVADWFESALRPPGEHTEREILSYDEVIAAEKLWHDGDRLKTRYDNDLNAFLHDFANKNVAADNDMP